MRITGEVLQKIEDKLWENLEELNKDEKQLIEYGNSSHYSICHFSDSYRYIGYIDVVRWLKKIVDDDESYIKHYGLEEFETEEEEANECKTKKAISTLKKEYQEELEGLLIGECTKNFGKGYGATVFSSAHYFEAGLDTLSKLEKKIGGLKNEIR